MNNIDSSNLKSNFFPNSKAGKMERTKAAQKMLTKRNGYDRMNELNHSTKQDAKVDIPDAIKDFSRIKKAVDASPDKDNTDKIARLKQQIQAGTYNVNYEAIADKLLAEEF
jgi:negative regulator of flagellin synthesis FlgM